MKKYLNPSTIFLQIVTLAIVLITSALLFSGSSCNAIKGRDSKEVANELNTKKFTSIADQRDAAFLVEVAEINLKEIHLAQLVQHKAKQIDIKELAKMVEKVNSNSLKSISKIADKKSIAIPTSTTNRGLQTAVFLNKKSGFELDNEYCDMMVVSQKHAIRHMEKIVEEATDEDIKNWALHSLPNFQKHLEHAETCQKKCNDI